MMAENSHCPACGASWDVMSRSCPSCGRQVYGGQDQDWTLTRGGRKFFALRPRLEDIAIDDIAVSLSRLARYGGHTKFMYTVGQHSCYVSDLLLPYGVKVALKGLLHDAAEAYIGDVSSPYKCLPHYEGYRAIEKNLEEAIFEAFKISGLDYWSLEIKAADMALFAAEVHQIMPYHAELIERAAAYRPADIPIEPWPEIRVVNEFMTRFKNLRRATDATRVD